VPGENNSLCLVVEYVSRLKRLKTECYFFYLTESPSCKWSSSSALRHLISKKNYMFIFYYRYQGGATSFVNVHDPSMPKHVKLYILLITTSFPIYKTLLIKAQELRKVVFALNLSTIYILFPK